MCDGTSPKKCYSKNILCHVLSKTTVIQLNLQCTLLVIGVLDFLCVTLTLVGKTCVTHPSCTKPGQRTMQIKASETHGNLKI